MVPGRHCTIHTPPCPSIPGFPSTSGTSRDHPRKTAHHIHPLVQVSRDSLVPRVLPGIVPGRHCTLHTPPCPSIPGFPSTSGTSRDGPRRRLHTTHTPLVQVSRDSLVPRVLPGMVRGRHCTLHTPPCPSIPVFPSTSGTSRDGPRKTLHTIYTPLSKYPGIP